MLLIGLAGCSATTQKPAATAPHETSPEPSAPAASQASPSPSAASGTVAVVPIPNAREPLPGVVTGGVPSDEDLRAAEALGYRTVVSLLPAADAGDESERVARLGMRFGSIPSAGPADLTEDNARRLAEVLNAPDRRPLILHCGSGNRAGALLALEAFYVEHASAQAAIDLGEKAGMTSLRPVVEQRLGEAAPPPPPVNAP
jgi:protein tyrosine phosphatase (PTP) superfamily phosphohydrolase (DUF442 family)